ncbi:MAG: DUF1080 domain-containing protein [Lewinellaceae bacterium]|nr:DUF1080 domain-containing protein [Phaeodactylibacter sp.]MCB9041608.1 DUF1080 domain-containing protein [Lewinellaceae bacterium]
MLKRLLILLAGLFPLTLFAQISTIGFNHLALSVSDIEASTVFYRDILDLEPIEVPDELKAIRSWFRFGGGQDLHLLAGRTEPVADNSRNSSHFSLTIPDADEVEAFLIEKGMDYHRQQRFDGAWQIYISDPDGYVIELNEPPILWDYLLNGKDLNGWDTYLGPQFPPGSEDRAGVEPIGLNKDPKQVFAMVQEDGKPALRISGEHFGGISTVKEFENYHLQLQFKWGKQKWHPRQDAKRDSGVLYHAVGQHGVDWGFWMRSQEFQVQEGDCGDYWGLDGATMDIPARRQGEKDWIYDPEGTVMAFAADTQAGRHCIKSPDAEAPTGEWNTLDLYCFGGTAVHVVNGKVTMVLYHSRHPEDGKMLPLTKGKIQIQSEGAEVFYRNIRIRTIDEIPAKALAGK